MSKPWTAIATDMNTGKRTSTVFHSFFDKAEAAQDFRDRYASMSLEAMIPGSHQFVYISNNMIKIT